MDDIEKEILTDGIAGMNGAQQAALLRFSLPWLFKGEAEAKAEEDPDTMYAEVMARHMKGTKVGTEK